MELVATLLGTQFWTLRNPPTVVSPHPGHPPPVTPSTPALTCMMPVILAVS